MKGLRHPDRSARYWPAPFRDDRNIEEAKKVPIIRALAIDAAKALIRYCLATEAAIALTKSREWLAVAGGAGVNDDLDIEAIRLVLTDSDTLINDSGEKRRSGIDSLLNQLGMLKRSATELHKALLAERNDADKPKGKSPGRLTKSKARKKTSRKRNGVR